MNSAFLLTSNSIPNIRITAFGSSALREPTVRETLQVNSTRLDACTARKPLIYGDLCNAFSHKAHIIHHAHSYLCAALRALFYPTPKQCCCQNVQETVASTNDASGAPTSTKPGSCSPKVIERLLPALAQDDPVEMTRVLHAASAADLVALNFRLVRLCGQRLCSVLFLFRFCMSFFPFVVFIFSLLEPLELKLSTAAPAWSRFYETHKSFAV